MIGALISILGFVSASPAPLGGKDEHGCIPSAGYSWCDSLEKCYRSWEEDCPASQHTKPWAQPFWTGIGPVILPEGFFADKTDKVTTEKATVVSKSTNAVGDIAEKVTAETMVGGEKDRHGCLVGAGYSLCEPLQKCVRSWETNCPIP